MADELRMLLLGGLQIMRGATPLPGLASHKAQALLCYLALTRRPQTRDALAGLFWSEVPQEEARASLRTVLSLLRKVAAAHLMITRDTIAFDPHAPYWLDVEVFRHHLSQATASSRPAGATSVALRAAVDLYRGEFLEGFYVLQAPAFEEWLLGEREWLHGQAMQALDRLAAECVREGALSAALDYLNRLLVLEPWREEARRELMRVLAALGQRSAALAQYETCRRILLAELGVEPSEDTTALYQQILSGPPAPAPAAPLPAPPVLHNLPAALTALLGRDVELAQLTDRLQRPSLRLLTLVGPGGIGKTRLALDLAARLRPDFPDGVFFIALAALHQAALLPSLIAQMLPLRPGGGQPVLAVLQAWLAQRRVLLVLDNFEQLLDATPTVIELLQAAPALKILVTSREPLRVIGEHQFPVLPLPVPTPARSHALESLGQFPSIALFCARAEAVRFGFALTAENAAPMVTICRQLDGSPLAIELAAARLRDLEVAEIARRLTDRFHLLNEGNRGAPPRHQTLRASIEWSYDLLDPADQRLFRRLAVMAGGWTDQAAGAICAEESSPRAEPADPPAPTGAGIRRLVDKSLVVVDRQTSRYGMHESIRQYADDRLAEAGEEAALRLRHLAYFTAWAEAAEPHLIGPDQLLWLDQLQAEHDNLRAALDWLHDQPARLAAHLEQGLRLAGALWRFWSIRGYTEEGLHRLEALIALRPRRVGRAGAVPAPDLPLAWAKVLNGAGVLAYARGEYAASRAYFEQNLALRRALGDKKGIAAALNNLAQTIKGQGHLTRARRLGEESLALKRELGDQVSIATSLGMLGNIAFDQADYPAARTLLTESVALERKAGYQLGLLTDLNNLGCVLLELGDAAGAQALIEESLALAEGLGDKPGLGRALGNLGRIAADQGEYAQAIALQQQSLEQFWQAGYVREISQNLEDLALLHGVRGQADAAARLLGAAEAVRGVTGYRPPPADQARRERGLAALRRQTQAAPDEWAAAYSAGRALTLEQAVQLAVGSVTP